MAEYIEREAALQALCEAVHAKDGNIPCRNQLVSCLWAGTQTQEYAEKILAIPASDVVPVVRCGDCKWFQINMRQDGYLPKGVPECECRHWCGACYPTDFCSYGALMDKDGDGDV